MKQVILETNNDDQIRDLEQKIDKYVSEADGWKKKYFVLE